MSFSIKLFKIYYILQKYGSRINWQKGKQLVSEKYCPQLTWSWEKWDKSKLYAELLTEGRQEPIEGLVKLFAKILLVFATMLAIYYFELSISSLRT